MRRDDAGVAALELVLVLAVLTGIATLVAPLPYALAQKSKLEYAANRTVRYATSTPSGQRPTAGVLAQEGRRAFAAAGGRVDGFTSSLTPTVAPGSSSTVATYCARRSALTVTLTNNVDLGAFGAILGAAGIGSGTVRTITARATSCEE